MKYLPHGSRMVFHISTFFDSRGLLTNPYRPCHASGRKSYGILPLNSRLSHLGSRFLFLGFPILGAGFGSCAQRLNRCLSRTAVGIDMTRKSLS